jgi:histone demethylase JARID1
MQAAFDCGELPLDLVYGLITEGENLSVDVEKELKVHKLIYTSLFIEIFVGSFFTDQVSLQLLRDRSILYCICRKPYDNRAMIACDQCDEWYHFDCINVCGPPQETFHCPACCPNNGEVFILLPRPASEEDRYAYCIFVLIMSLERSPVSVDLLACVCVS